MYGKFILTTLAFAICLHSTQAISAQMATNAGGQTVPKQFTFRHAGVNLKGLDPRVDKVKVECFVMMPHGTTGANVLDIAGRTGTEFPVVAHHSGGGTVNSGPFTLSLNVGDGITETGGNPADVTHWICALQLMSGNELSLSSFFGTSDSIPCMAGMEWACMKPGSGIVRTEGRF